MVEDSLEEAGAILRQVEYRAGPSVLIIGDSAPGRERCERAARAAGCRILDSIGLEGAEERLARLAARDAVLLHLEHPHDNLERLFHGIAENIEEGLHGGVVVTSLPLVDKVSAWLLPTKIQHLCEPSDLDMVAAVATTAAQHRPRLHDVGKSAATVRLQQLSEEIGRVATMLAALSEDEVAVTALVGGDRRESEAEQIEAGQIRSIIRARRLRDQFFKSELFADPAWDMLLDLMAARIEKKPVAVSSLCIAAAVPPTTALRWIKALCDQGIFIRIADREDGRRVFIELSEQSAAAMEGFLKAAQRVSPLLL